MAKNSVLRLLRDKKALFEKLKAAIEILEKASLIIEAEPDPSEGEMRGRGRPRGAGVPQAGSAVGRAIALLKAAGAPLHIDQMSSELGVKKSSLVSSLSKLANTDRWVRRVGPGMFEAIPDSPPATVEPENAEMVH